MIDTSNLNKRYYTISEVAQLFNVAKSLLRFWEGEFEIISPKKGRNGIRRYTVDDIVKINQVYDLLKKRGFTIDGARKELKKKRTRKKTVERDTSALKKRLGELHKRMTNLRNHLDTLS